MEVLKKYLEIFSINEMTKILLFLLISKTTLEIIFILLKNVFTFLKIILLLIIKILLVPYRLLKTIF